MVGVPHWQYDLSESVANEWLCARLLAELGFAVADSSIETFGGQQVLCVERFDRAWTAQGWIARLPQEDFCQVRGVASANKYETHGGPRLLQGLQGLQQWKRPCHGLPRPRSAHAAFSVRA